MGMASSQARLLSLTSRQHSIELKAQVLQAQKLQLANDSDAAYDNYVKTLDATKLQTKLFNQDGKQAWVEASVNNLMRINSPETYGNTFLVKNIDDGKIYLPQSVAEKYESANGDEERFLQLNGITRTIVEDSTAKDAAKAKVDEAIAKGWGKLPKHEDFGELTSDIYYNYKALEDYFDDATTLNDLLTKFNAKDADGNYTYTLKNSDYTKMVGALNNLRASSYISNDQNLDMILSSYYIPDEVGQAHEATGFYNANVPHHEYKLCGVGDYKGSYMYTKDTWTRDASIDFSGDTRLDALDVEAEIRDVDSNGNPIATAEKTTGVKELTDANKALLYLLGGSYTVSHEEAHRYVLYRRGLNEDGTNKTSIDWWRANDDGRNDATNAEQSGLAIEKWSNEQLETLGHKNNVWYYSESSDLSKELRTTYDSSSINEVGYYEEDSKLAPYQESIIVTDKTKNIYDDEMQAAIDAYLGETGGNVSKVLEKLTAEVLPYQDFADEVEQYDTAYENYVQYTVDLQEYKNTPVNKYVQYNNSVSGPYYENLFKAIQLSDGYHVISNAQAKDGDWVNSMARSGKVVLSIYETDKKEMNDYSAFSHPGLQEVANEGEMAVADVEYENALDAINSKELKISRRLSRLETERAAIKTEIDSIKQIRSDNINVAFKVFG